MFEIDANCTYTTWSIPSSHCSGHGTCILGTGRCICDSGYTGSSDFINLKGKDCHINIERMKVLWSLASLLALISVIQLSRALRMSYRSLNHTGQNRSQRLKNGITHLRRQFIYRPSLTFIIIPAGFWGTTLMARLILNLSLRGLNLKGNKKLQDDLQGLYRKLILKGYFDHLACIVMGTLGLIGGESNSYNLYTSMYFCIQGWVIVSFLMYNIFFTSIAKTIGIAFGNAGNTESVDKIKTRILRLLPVTRVVMVIFALLALLFLIYPPLYKHWAYFWLFILAAIAVLSTFAAHVFLVRKRESVNTVTVRGANGSITKTIGSYKSGRALGRFNSNESTFKKSRTTTIKSNDANSFSTSNPFASNAARASYVRDQRASTQEIYFYYFFFYFSSGSEKHEDEIEDKIEDSKQRNSKIPNETKR
ncbi:hypothetical protein TL16_g09697 [Triparma laevis f. inornata]|uniref:Epidermal growth factor-like domain-containing protein n=1 Tax=Triparma laevis f. inornata TaxID=1714386 RepID=A0A9W7EK11_9STRA|nr:hypothetical protein TL16_g09697 [Triparma laevis f. inornata]